MLNETVDAEITTAYDDAKTAVFPAAFPAKALAGHSVVVSLAWFMQ
jgi:hypothetical protein